MKKALACLALFGLVSGCAWMDFGDDSSTVSATEEAQGAPAEEAVQMEQAAPAPQKTSAKASKGAKSEAQIKAELDQMAQKLVNQSARTLLPNAANKEVKKVGSSWVATYMNVDTKNIYTEMRPGKAKGLYVGSIRYHEEIMECRGNTRAEALSAPCQKAGSRKLTELISYDGKQWQD